MKTLKQLQEIIGKDIKSDYKTLDLKAFFQKHGKKKSEISSFVSEAKEKSEYDYEGDMARGQLQSIVNNAQKVHDMLEDNDNLPEWVQSKITLAEDYISTVANYMMSEIDEAVEVGDDPINTGTPDNLGKKNGKTTVAKSLPVTEDTIDEMAGANMDVRQVHKHLKKSGWSLTRTSGGHDVYTHPKSTEHIAVPRHRSLKAPLVLGIMKTAKKVSEEVEQLEEAMSGGGYASFQKETGKIGYIGNKRGMIKHVKSNPDHIRGYTSPDRKVGDIFGGYPKKTVKEEHLEEGRPSQQHPLEGHEYHKKSDAELEYIAKDAHEAAEAMKSHGTESGRRAENKYRDQASDSATVRYFRKKSGMPDWYKKKYGHVKEEVELDEASKTRNPTRDFLRKNPVNSDEMAKPVSRKAQIVKSAAGKDKFIVDPIISNTNVKADGDQR
jgi:predicted RNA binding protein YcfA (HicA-like mRNA interferase family)